MIPEIASAIGQGAQSLQNLAQTGWQMDFNRDESKKSRDFNFMMATRKYQLAMADMRAAGLNPLLAASGGGFSPASASAGAASIGGMASAPDYVEGSNRTKRTVQDIKQSEQMIKQSEALADQIAANERFLDEKAITERAQQKFLSANTQLTHSNAVNAMLQSGKIEADIAYLAERMETERTQQRLNKANASFVGNKDAAIQPLAEFLRGADVSTSANEIGQFFQPENLENAAKTHVWQAGQVFDRAKKAFSDFDNAMKSKHRRK